MYGRPCAPPFILPCMPLKKLVSGVSFADALDTPRNGFLIKVNESFVRGLGATGWGSREECLYVVCM